MQLITLLSAAATIALASANSQRSAVTLNQQCDLSKAYARVINRCPYEVYLWSVYKGEGCPVSGMVTLKTGEVYNENYQAPLDGVTGVSIKISKTQQCKGNDIVQLEYFLEQKNKAYANNYLDVSYVDCLGNTCPTRQEGYYLVAGSQTGAAKASAGNTWCPILSCHDQASCDKCSYVLPDDVQTKTCDLDSSMDFYMCGGEAPTQDYSNAPVKSPSPSPAPKPSSIDDTYKIKAAAVTSSPAAPEPPKVKTEVVYVTAYEYVNAKRHAHGHARRHGNFRA